MDKEFEPIERLRQKEKRRLKTKIRILEDELGTKRISRQRKADAIRSLSFLKKVYEDNYPKPLRTSDLDARFAKMAQSDEVNSLILDSTSAIGAFIDLVKRLKSKIGLTVEQETTLQAMFLMWQPHQKIRRPVHLPDLIEWTLFRLRQRNSAASAELKKIIRIHPLHKQYITKSENAKESNADEILKRGPPYWRLVPSRNEYSAQVKDILKNFENLRPFLSDALAPKVANELANLLNSRGIEEVSCLPFFYSNIVWYQNIPKMINGFDNYLSYRMSKQSGELGRTNVSELIDFSVIKLDEIFRAVGFKRGRDPIVMEIVNTMAYGRRPFKKPQDVAERRRNLSEKRTWKRRAKMGLVELERAM